MWSQWTLNFKIYLIRRLWSKKKQLDLIRKFKVGNVADRVLEPGGIVIAVVYAGRGVEVKRSIAD